MRLTLFTIVFTCFTLYGQQSPPLNSNYLIENGISPQVLDAALSTTLQEGSFTSEVYGKRIIGNDTLSTFFRLIYNPEINDGLDIQIAINKDSIQKKGEKAILRSMESTHSFSRLSRSELYDASSLTLIDGEGNNLKLSFRYDKKKLEPELRYGRVMKGIISIEDGILKSVSLENLDDFKMDGTPIAKGDFKRTIYYTKNKDIGGYYVSSGEDEYSFREKGKVVKILMKSFTSGYRSLDGKHFDTSVDSKPFEFVTATDTLSGSLGWALPLFGKGAKKLGYKLPRPIGLNIFAHYQIQKLSFTDLEISINDGEVVGLEGLLDLEESTVDQSTLLTMLKADVWILPFLNIMAIYGSGTNTINGKLLINSDLRDFLIGIGVDPNQIPDRIPVESDLTAAMIGGGATLAGGIGNWNASVNYQFMVSQLEEVNTTKVAHVISPSIGYMTPFGMNIMAGAQGQFYDPSAVGYIDLPDGDRLNYNVGFKPQVWNYMIGLYTPLSDHFELAVQSGWGERTSLTIVFGYRF